MTEEEKRILETICKALPYMDRFDKGYFLAVAEMKAREHEEEKHQEEQELIKA